MDPTEYSYFPTTSPDVDPASRPGVPMRPERLVPSAGAHIDAPRQRHGAEWVTKRRALAELPIVFGTAQPPHGLSGWLRRFAYRIPETRARHWALLFAADRVDVIEHRMSKTLGVALVGGVAIVAAGALLGRRRERRRFADLH